jgi:hypothetical protein
MRRAWLEALKPYLLLALAAFLTGFVCYAGVGAPRPRGPASPGAQAPLVSAPASSDWNLPKHI